VLNGFGDDGEIEKIRSGLEREYGVRVAYDGADMSKGEAVRGLIEATIEQFGRLDILVNNAGIQFTALVDEFPAAKWHAILDINLSRRSTASRRRYTDEEAALGRIVNIAPAHGLDAQGRLCRRQAWLVGLTKVVGWRPPAAA